MGSPHTILKRLMEVDHIISDVGTGNEILNAGGLKHGGVMPIVTGSGAETNTLGSPSYVGQTIGLYMKTDGGGDRVVTVASTVNQTGNNTLTFGAARDHIILTAISDGSTLEWSVLMNDGVALSTV